MEGPNVQNQAGYQALNGSTEDEFELGCLNKLNNYLIVKCVPPTRKVKSNVFVTKLVMVISTFFCACLCVLPFYCASMELIKSVSLLGAF